MNMPATICTFLILLTSLTAMVGAQTRKPKKVKPTTAPVVAATPQPLSTPELKTELPAKRNERPGGGSTKPDTKPIGSIVPTYFYEFTRPGFSYSRILIEHDELGKGQISFQKGEFDEVFTDPLEISTSTLTHINDALTALTFLDSTEDYQYARDYSHMGNVRITFRKGGRERTVKYNWTENKNAKILMDEYRRIANEYTWKFEITVARSNQPLLTPGLMDAVDAYLRRNEIADPPHLVPFLTQLSSDERLPLMARNHATKLIKQIEKTRK